MEDPQLLDFLRLMTDARDIEISRVLNLLFTGGVLFKRGHQYRLMPDLLGDYLIEKSCIDHRAQLSTFAQTVLREIPLSLLSNVLVNLGRLDWRRNSGDPANSKLLDAMWQTLHEITDEYDPRFDAIRAVAIFQPHQALKFVEDRFRQRRPIREAAKIVRNVAYNAKYLERCCELLWEMGRNDNREPNQLTEHPARVLAGMCGFEQQQRFDLIEPVFEFGMRLLDRPNAWSSHFSPLDILKPILSVEGVTTEFRRRQLVMSPFSVNYDAVSPFRSRLIDRILALLTHPDASVASRAARFLQNAVHGPRGIMGARISKELDDKLTVEAVDTLTKVVSIMAANTLHPCAHLGLAASVCWLARRAQSDIAAAAQAVLDAMPTHLKFRVQAALSDGYGQVFIDMTDGANWQANVQNWIAGLVAEVRNSFPDQRERLQFVSSAADELRQGGGNEPGGQILVALVRGDAAYARVVVSAAIQHPISTAAVCLPAALHELLQQAPDEARVHIAKLLDGSNSTLAQSAVMALGGEMPPRTAADVALLDKAFGSPDPMVVGQALQISMSWQSADTRVLIQMARKVRLDIYPTLAHSLAMMLAGLNARLLDALDRDDAIHFLQLMLRLPNLEDYWLQEFISYLSYRFPHELAEYFFERVELAASAETFNDIRPANHGPFCTKKLRFVESSEASAILSKAWAWLRKNHDRDYYFHHHAADLFDAMFITSNGNTVSNDMVALFESRVEMASPVELKLMARILRHADPRFIFTHRPFVVRILDRCRDADPEILSFVVSELHASAVSGVRTSTVGEPAMRDVEMLADAQQALKDVSHLSPAHGLYDDVRKSGEWHISRSREDAEAFDGEG